MSCKLVTCCTAQQAPQGQLRCRFPGFKDVTATLGDDGITISCCPPVPAQVDLEASSYDVLDYTVLDEHDNLIYRSDLNNSSEPCKATRCTPDACGTAATACQQPNCQPSSAAGCGKDQGTCGGLAVTCNSSGGGGSGRNGAADGGSCKDIKEQSADGQEADFGRRENETRKEYLKREYSALKPFVIISLSYLLFTTTDGAVRMIVLLHAYRLGFTAWQVAIMFTLYELAGVVTNLLAGLMGAKWGIKWTLLTGLSLQLAGLGMLFGWQESWAVNGQVAEAIIFVTAAQMLCGVAKDLTKLGGKTVTKLVTPDEKQSRLFKVVSFITGFKNSMKGVGYFIGAAALTVHYYFALGLLMLLILAAMPWAIVGLSNELGRARKENIQLSTLFKQRYNVNVLSAARFFLFGSRDMWFEVPLPFFLRDHVYGLGWERVAVGAMLAGFIILYGQVQSWTPQLVLQPLKQSPANKYVELLWNGLLVLAPTYLAIMLLGTPIFTTHQLPAMTGVLISGLLLYCVLFAVNSSVHSFLIVKYSEGDKVAMNVGFYYMANAMGRLTGTLVSGALYTYAGANVVYGLGWCFVASIASAAASTALTTMIRDDEGGLVCGSKLVLVE